MKIKIVKEYVAAIKEIDEDERTLTALVSTGEKDRVGEYIPPEEWKLANYEKNPVILWAHNYNQPPVAKALWTKTNKKGLIQKIKFAKTAFANDIYDLYKDGFLNAFSVGFQSERDATDSNIFRNCELLEVSCVPVPCNANALVERLTAGLFKSPEGIAFAKSFIEKETINKPEPEETENFIRIRIKDPALFQEGSFRTIDIDKKQGISSVIGKLKGEDATTVQNYMFDKRVKDWTIAEAVKWVEEHKGDKIEAPEEEKQEFNCECIDCGYKQTSTEHCSKLTCPECGGKMRRQERPGDGRPEDKGNKESAFTRDMLAELKNLEAENEVLKKSLDELFELKEGRVLSKKNRELIKSAVDALNALLEATDPEAEADKSIDKREKFVIINNNKTDAPKKPGISAKELKTAIENVNIAGLIRGEIKRIKGEVE